MIAPGATLGVLGGGQLGRMFAHAAQRLGYRVAVLDPDPDSPAGRIAEHHLEAGYEDEQALARLAALCAAVTTEFENVPAASLRRLARTVSVAPGADAVEIAQDRKREKAFFEAAGVACARWASVTGHQDIAPAGEHTGYPALLKSARLGYDGKGQRRVDDRAQAEAAFAELGGVRCVLEQNVTLAAEVSVVLARNAHGRCACFPVVENRHRQGILDRTLAPARVAPPLAEAALAAAASIAAKLDYRGVLAVEFFVTADGRLLANEMAPRPHNSGHFTIEACHCSQFEQQVRALCDLPLGDGALRTPAVMRNLLGDLWRDARAPDWSRALAMPGVALHLYGKAEARAGRKMGHLTASAESVEAALRLAERAFEALGGPPEAPGD